MQASFGIDVTDLKMSGFVEPQSHRVHGPEIDGDSLDTDGVNDPMDLGHGKHLGQGLGILQLHRRQGFPVSLASSGVEELDPGEGDAKRAVGKVAFIFEVEEYAAYEITVEIMSGVVEGKFPRRALAAVLEWYNLHQDELSENWELSRQEQPLNRIAPLE